jgi:tetratricopeptide (TPR) repeat protein
MKKENILFGIIGLLIGLIIGFVATNTINRNGYGQATTSAQTAAPAANPQTGQPQFVPPQQVPNQAVKEQPQRAAMPGVQQAIDRARNEPENFEAQIAAAEMYYRIQNFDEAAQYFERANKLQPENYDIIVKLGNIYYDKAETAVRGGTDGTENFKISEKWYTAALAKKPDDVNVRTDLGLTFLLRQPPETDRAIKEFRTSLEKNPAHELTLQNLAAALQSKGDTAGLQETLTQLGKVNPQNPALERFGSKVSQ